MDDDRIPTIIEARAIVAVIEAARRLHGINLTYPQALDLVVATIREMRTPTEEMIGAMQSTAYGKRPGQPGWVSPFTKHRLRWEAAIDVACPAANTNGKDDKNG